MGLLAKIQKKIKKQTHRESINSEEIDQFVNCIGRISTGTNSDPFAGQDGLLGALLGGSLGGLGMAQQQQSLEYQRFMARQTMAMPSHLTEENVLSFGTAMGMCQPSRPGRKHVDCHIVEPKGLPESPRGA